MVQGRPEPGDGDKPCPGANQLGIVYHKVREDEGEEAIKLLFTRTATRGWAHRKDLGVQGGADLERLGLGPLRWAPQGSEAAAGLGWGAASLGWPRCWEVAEVGAGRRAHRQSPEPPKAPRRQGPISRAPSALALPEGGQW